jgi:hypothetical protein
MPSFIEHFNSARRASAPLLAVRTPDIEATIKTVAMNKANAIVPIILWDCTRGVTPVNDQGKALVQTLAPTTEAAERLGNPTEMLVMALNGDFHRPNKERGLPGNTILFMANLHLFFRDPQVVQGIWNLRGAFKMNTRTMVMVSSDFTLPPEIAQDVLILDEPLPTAAQLEGVIEETYNAVGQKKPDAATMSRAVDALCGLAAFPAEQVCAMTIRKEGLDIEQLWERKRQQIEQTPGLSVWRGDERFSDIGGCVNIKAFLEGIKDGEERPRGIVFQDEIEKAYAGAAGDLSGTSQELLGNQLSFMQDHNSTGLLLLGVPGAAKSAIVKAFGNEAGIPTIQFDLGAMKGSLVGESNANMRTGLKVVEAVTQGRAIWIATCNDIKNLPPELRRRYIFGTFFFDLPIPSERKLIWDIYYKKFQIKENQPKPLDTGWTGAEIRNCCNIAYRLGITPQQAATYIIPLALSAKERIANLRRDAHDCFISAAYPGPYHAPEGSNIDVDDREITAVAVLMSQPKRKISTDEDKGPKGKPN